MGTHVYLCMHTQMHSPFFTTEAEDFHKKQHTYLGVPGDQEGHWDLRNRGETIRKPRTGWDNLL